MNDTIPKKERKFMTASKYLNTPHPTDIFIPTEKIITKLCINFSK